MILILLVECIMNYWYTLWACSGCVAAQQSTAGQDDFLWEIGLLLAPLPIVVGVALLLGKSSAQSVEIDENRM
jgi:hypothetical protein